MDPTTRALAPRALRLLDMLEADPERLVERIVVRVRRIDADELGYENVDSDELGAAVAANVRLAIHALRARRSASTDELAQAAAVGELRARQGVTLEGVLRGFRAGAREALELIGELAAARRLDSATTISVTAALWDWVDDVSVAIATGHRRAELAMASRDRQERAAFVRHLVRGSLPPAQLVERAAAFGLDAEAPHHVVRVRPDAAHPLEEIERSSRWTDGVAGAVDDDVVAIVRRPPEGLTVAAGLGPAVPLAAIWRSFRLATRALEAAIAFGRSGCLRLEDLSLHAGVATDDQLGELMAARYLEPLRALGPFGEELLHSMQLYVEHDQSVDAAARALFVHPNTLRHRLRRFEAVTGASLRNVEQLAELWWALAYARLGPR